MMEKIGKYNGCMCYKCDIDEYDRLFYNGGMDDKSIYIIDGTMVKKSIIIGYYDGKRVEDDYEGREYFGSKKVKVEVPQEEPKTATSSTTGLEVKEINYSDYTGVVDKFFEELKTKG